MLGTQHVVAPRGLAHLDWDSDRPPEQDAELPLEWDSAHQVRDRGRQDWDSDRPREHSAERQLGQQAGFRRLPDQGRPVLDQALQD
jgi:hypothetical protein